MSKAEIEAPDVLDDMPADPRWIAHADGYLTHAYGGGCGIAIPPGPKQLRHRQECDWWHCYYEALSAVERLRAALRPAARAKRPRKQATIGPTPAPPPPAVETRKRAPELRRREPPADAPATPATPPAPALQLEQATLF